MRPCAPGATCLTRSFARSEFAAEWAFSPMRRLIDQVRLTSEGCGASHAPTSRASSPLRDRTYKRMSSAMFVAPVFFRTFVR